MGLHAVVEVFEEPGDLRASAFLCVLAHNVGRGAAGVADVGDVADETILLVGGEFGAGEAVFIDTDGGGKEALDRVAVLGSKVQAGEDEGGVKGGPGAAGGCVIHVGKPVLHVHDTGNGIGDDAGLGAVVIDDDDQVGAVIGDGLRD